MKFHTVKTAVDATVIDVNKEITVQPDESINEDRIEQLPQDGETPFQPADPNPSTTGNTTDPLVQGTDTELPDDHPATDASMDETELYDEGISGAAEVEDQSNQSAVTGLVSEDDETDDPLADQAL
jgi:hypothetical protein